MPSIRVTTFTAARLRLLAAAWETDEEGAINRLIDRMASTGPEAPAPEEQITADRVQVHATYEEHRITGLYESPTHSLTVTSSPLEGRSYKSPSGAAIAVVQALNPRVNPSRNGWTFWTVTATGATLQSLRRE